MQLSPAALRTVAEDFVIRGATVSSEKQAKELVRQFVFALVLLSVLIWPFPSRTDPSQRITK